MTRPWSRPAASVVWPLALMAAAIAILAFVQLRWLRDLEHESRRRMERDLRVAVQTVAAEVSLEMPRLGARADGTPPLDSLLPEIARRIEARAEIRPAVELRRREGAGWRVAGRVGPGGLGDADVVAPIELEGPRRRVVFIDSSADARALVTGAGPASWSVAEPSSIAPDTAGSAWTVHVWHEAGSLERAVGAIRRRNLAIGLGLIGVLTLSAAAAVRALRRGERLAVDRATILAGISHEVRTPLAVIRSAAENLSGGVVETPQAVREYGQLIDVEAGRLEDNLEGALAFARAAGLPEAPLELVDLRTLAAEVSAGSDRVDTTAGDPVMVRVDRRSMMAAIRNLVANALAYSPAGERVTVTVLRRGGSAEVAVGDRGPGVPVAERERIFEPFYRGQVGTASPVHGLGLGLALADRVAALHRGSVRFEERSGGGSVFRLMVPAA